MGPDRSEPRRLSDDQWQELRRAARDAASHSHAPFSRLCVGAAGLTSVGTTLSGCNVESSSYGVTLCAECGLISAATLRSVTLVAVAVQSVAGDVLMPCGRCRQLLIEHGGPHLVLDGPRGELTASDLLPEAFTSTDLPKGP